MIARSRTVAFMAALLSLPLAARADDAANQALARQFYAEFNARDFDGMAAIVADDLANHTGEADGGDALVSLMRQLAAGMSDVRLTVELITIDGDYVTVVANVRGTGGGMMPADQHIVTYAMIDVWRIESGQLAELWRATTAR